MIFFANPGVRLELQHEAFADYQSFLAEHCFEFAFHSVVAYNDAFMYTLMYEGQDLPDGWYTPDLTASSSILVPRVRPHPGPPRPGVNPLGGSSRQNSPRACNRFNNGEPRTNPEYKYAHVFSICQGCYPAKDCPDSSHATSANQAPLRDRVSAPRR